VNGEGNPARGESTTSTSDGLAALVDGIVNAPFALTLALLRDPSVVKRAVEFFPGLKKSVLDTLGDDPHSRPPRRIGYRNFVIQLFRWVETDPVTGKRHKIAYCCAKVAEILSNEPFVSLYGPPPTPGAVRDIWYARGRSKTERV
jgi:hypothetical protein